MEKEQVPDQKHPNQLVTRVFRKDPWINRKPTQKNGS
jgi:hypothetical protein